MLKWKPKAQSQRPEAGKWLVPSGLTGTFLSVMDVSVVNVAMPHMMGSFGQDLLTITVGLDRLQHRRDHHDHDDGVLEYAARTQTPLPRSR